MVAFEAHFIKEVSRAQLGAAVKTLLPSKQRKSLYGAEKSKLIKPLAKMFVYKGIIDIRRGAKPENLTRSDVTKTATF